MSYYEDAWLTIFEGDCREVLRNLEPESVNCVVSSPPYFGLRDYGIAPTVWGGDGHEHKWAAGPDRKVGNDPSPLSTLDGGKEASAQALSSTKRADRSDRLSVRITAG